MAKMKVYTKTCKKEYSEYKTLNQWNKVGYLIKEDEEPILMHPNRWSSKIFKYFSPEQVRKANKKEKKELEELFREKSRLASQKSRATKRKRVRPLYRARKLRILEKLCNEVKPYQKVVLDCETTGLDSFYDEILQFSAINEKGETLMNCYVKPRYNKSWNAAMKVNGITPEMVENCKSIEYYYEDIQKILLSATEIITYNGYFDFEFLEAVGLCIPDVPLYDVMREFAPIYGEWNDYYDDYKWQKLTKCAAYYGYKFEAHDSLEDVKATLHCYNEMHKQ